jgi:hypothetical protein
MTYLKSIAAELLIGLLAILAALALGYTQGAKHNQQKWLANQAKVERSVRADYDEQVHRGELAAAQYLKDTRALTGQFNQLTEKFNGLRKRIPLLVSTGPSHTCPADLRRPQQQPSGAANSGNSTKLDTDVLDGPVLTDGAVWMWNSALTGADQPSGACSAANPTAAACAAATSATLNEAWDNHIANAQACAENRLAHQRLIDFINASNLRKTAP